MKRKTIYTEQYVECEYEIQFSDILDIIEECDDSEIEKIKKDIGVNENQNTIRASNIYEEQKIELLKVAFDKYTLDELMEKLNIKYSEF